MGRSIAVAGKGGTGKSTIAALLILALKERGLGPVLAIDSDPDSSLCTLLGVNQEQTLGDLREEVHEKIKNFPPGMTKANYVEAGLHQVIVEAEGFDLITMGRGEGSGCYCYL
ncbi:MAG: carbon monoxide dehydrogenase, partial [Spirochaetota bacterium]